jgi:DNA helicase-2/ATP-dependent DNA helicase PcrA
VIATYHSYAARLIADHALREALEPTMRLITPAVAWQLAARNVAAYDGPMDAVDWAPVTVTAAVVELSAELAEHLRGPEDVLAAGDWLRRRFDELQPATLSQGRSGGDESASASNCSLPCALPWRPSRARGHRLRRPDGARGQPAMAHSEVGRPEREVPGRAARRVPDVSHAQLELMRALFGGGHLVTAVGDPCQSTCWRRGASAGNMRRFADLFPLPGTTTPRFEPDAKRARSAGRGRLLSTSFRNTGRCSMGRPIQRDLREIAPEVPRLIAPADRAARGSVVCALLETTADEATWVAGQVAGLLRMPAGTAPDGRPWPDHRTDAVRPSDIAVLCRKRTQFAALRSALEAEGIPVEVVGLGGLLTVPEVSDIVATLRVLHSPAASDSLIRTLPPPRWRIGPQDLVALDVRARALVAGQTRAAALRLPPGHPRETAPDDTHAAGSPVAAHDHLTWRS